MYLIATLQIGEDGKAVVIRDNTFPNGIWSRRQAEAYCKEHSTDDKKYGWFVCDQPKPFNRIHFM